MFSIGVSIGVADFTYPWIADRASILEKPNDDTLDYAMVSAINQLAHRMEIKTIAEFVEDRTIYEKLQVAGIDYVQGYFISKPVLFEELLKAFSGDTRS